MANNMELLRDRANDLGVTGYATMNEKELLENICEYFGLSLTDGRKKNITELYRWWADNGS